MLPEYATKVQLQLTEMLNACVGDTLHYRFISDYTGADWGFKFTVTGRRVGKFDTGALLLETLLSSPSLTRSALS